MKRNIHVSGKQMEKKLSLIKKKVVQKAVAQTEKLTVYYISLPHKTEPAKFKKEELLPFLITVSA